MIDAKQLEHGEYGEGLVVATLAAKGWAHKGPWWVQDGQLALAPPGVAHLFDHCFMQGNRCFFADSKAKAKRTVYGDTGVNLAHFDKYWKLFADLKSQIKDFLLMFIDEGPTEERIYFVSLAELYNFGLEALRQENKIRVEVTSYGKTLILFDCSLWHHFRQLTRPEVERLKALCKRNYDYE